MSKKTRFNQKIFNITITVLLYISIIICLAFPFRLSVLRLATAFKDSGIEIANQFIRYDKNKKLLPDNIDKLPDYKKYLYKNSKKQKEINKEGSRSNDNTIKERNARYWKFFKDKKIFQNYLIDYLVYLTYGIQALMMLVIVVLLFKILIKEHFKRIKVAPEEKTRYLKAWQGLERGAFERIKQTIKGYIEFVNRYKVLKWIYIILLAIAANLVTIVLEFFAFYFKFFRTMDISKIPYQFYKLGYDLKIYFKTVPVTAHIVIVIYLFNALRRRIALRRLQIYESRNSGLVENMPICSMLVGTMGTKKTTILTDMALTLTNCFKLRALEDLQKIRKEYPKFNFSKLDDFLKRCIIHHQIYSLKSVDAIWEKKLQRSLKSDKMRMLGESLLDFSEFSDGLSLTDIFSSFIKYSKLFLVYYINSALIYSNYAIRYDFQYSSVGNFPLYNSDFFSSVEYSIDSEEISTYSHILDFDMLRLGKKLIEDSEVSKVYDFGFFALTEIGKERGNQITTQGLKRMDEDTNQKNDYFNAFVKLIRHTSTINNYPYCKFLADEQRPESLEVDLRDLFDIVRIKRSDKYKCVFPLYFERPFLECINEIYDKYNLERIFYRSNDSLKYYLARKIIGWLYGVNTRILNKYGVYKCDLEIETSGINDIQSVKYYLMKKKIYSNRFKTDAYNSFFKASRSDLIGIGDINQYESTRASKAELQAQNSYFIRDLSKYNHIEDKR